jgi:hypothetical protein
MKLLCDTKLMTDGEDIFVSALSARFYMLENYASRETMREN